MMLGLIKPTSGEIIIQNKNINTFERNELLSIMNFASPYVELPKKLSVKQNLRNLWKTLWCKKFIFKDK